MAEGLTNLDGPLTSLRRVRYLMIEAFVAPAKQMINQHPRRKREEQSYFRSARRIARSASGAMTW